MHCIYVGESTHLHAEMGHVLTGLDADLRNNCSLDVITRPLPFLASDSNIEIDFSCLFFMNMYSTQMQMLFESRVSKSAESNNDHVVCDEWHGSVFILDEQHEVKFLSVWKYHPHNVYLHAGCWVCCSSMVAKILACFSSSFCHCFLPWGVAVIVNDMPKY